MQCLKNTINGPCAKLLKGDKDIALFETHTNTYQVPRSRYASEVDLHSSSFVLREAYPVGLVGMLLLWDKSILSHSGKLNNAWYYMFVDLSYQP